MARAPLKLKRALRAFVEKITYTELSPEKIKPVLDDIVILLLECDVAYDVAEVIVSKLKERLTGVKAKRSEDRREIVLRILRETLVEILSSPGKIDLVKLAEEKRKKGAPLVMLFVGPNGHGKTTTIAKLAKWFKDRGFVPVVAAADTFRAGAIEQLEEHARRVGFKVIKHRYGADPAAVAYDAVAYAKTGKADVVLIDTAGRLQTDVNLLEEMKKIARVVKPDLTVFVGDALTGNDALDQALKFDRAVGIDASILVKMDADAKGGAALSIVYATGKPLLFIGTGQGYDDLIEFDPEVFVDTLLK